MATARSLSWEQAISGTHSSWDLKRRISNMLIQRGVSSQRRIDIDVADGVVTLRGTVCSFYERQLCLACATHVCGVRRLVDRIEVELPSRLTAATAIPA